MLLKTFHHSVGHALTIHLVLDHVAGDSQVIWTNGYHVNGAITWQESNTVSSSNLWAPGEPGDTGCIQMHGGYYSYMFDDTECDYNLHPMCEIEI